MSSLKVFHHIRTAGPLGHDVDVDVDVDGVDGVDGVGHFDISLSESLSPHQDGRAPWLRDRGLLLPRLTLQLCSYNVCHLHASFISTLYLSHKSYILMQIYCHLILLVFVCAYFAETHFATMLLLCLLRPCLTNNFFSVSS